MAQPFTLQPLLDLMQTRADEATRQLGLLIAAEQNQRSRLEMLVQYRSEYAQQLHDASANGVTRQIMRNYQDFLARIDAAITQQSAVVDESERSTQAGQEHWQKQNTRLKAIDALSQRHDARERYREGRQEQKLLDEFSTRKFSATRTQDK
ncbi:MAG: flagellar export protein FliJ [Desulfobulbus sp.]|nr:flagellar export protein FliJ [Desulfobulbus sp.]